MSGFADRRGQPPMQRLRVLSAVALGVCGAAALAFSLLILRADAKSELGSDFRGYVPSLMIVALYCGIAAMRAIQRYRRSLVVINLLRVLVLVIAATGVIRYVANDLEDRVSLFFAGAVATTVVIDAFAARVHRGKLVGARRNDD